jgi:hypothetical protein
MKNIETENTQEKNFLSAVDMHDLKTIQTMVRTNPGVISSSDEQGGFLEHWYFDEAATERARQIIIARSELRIVSQKNNSWLKDFGYNALDKEAEVIRERYVEDSLKMLNWLGTETTFLKEPNNFTNLLSKLSAVYSDPSDLEKFAEELEKLEDLKNMVNSEGIDRKKIMQNCASEIISFMIKHGYSLEATDIYEAAKVNIEKKPINKLNHVIELINLSDNPNLINSELKDGHSLFYGLLDTGLISNSKIIDHFIKELGLKLDQETTFKIVTLHNLSYEACKRIINATELESAQKSKIIAELFDQRGTNKAFSREFGDDFLDSPVTQLVLLNKGFKVGFNEVIDTARNLLSSTELEKIKKMLENCPEYINLVDKDGCSIFTYVQHHNGMKEWLFQNGYIPHGNEYLVKEAKLGDITGNQTVHHSLVNKSTNFVIKKLVTMFTQNKDLAQLRVELFEDLCSLEKIKTSTMLPFSWKNLHITSKQDIFGERHQEFRDFDQIKKELLTSVKSAITKYLKVGSEYSQYSHTYDLKNDKSTTFENIILSVYRYIKEREYLSSDESSLAVLGAIYHNLEHNKISAIESLVAIFGVSREDIQNNLKNSGYWIEKIKSKKADEVFHNLTGHDLLEYKQLEGLAIFVEQIYIAANTYGNGEASSACVHGIISQAVSAINRITPNFIDSYALELKHDTWSLNQENAREIVEGTIKAVYEAVNQDPALGAQFQEFMAFNRTANSVTSWHEMQSPTIIKLLNTKMFELISTHRPQYLKDYPVPKIEDYVGIIRALQDNALLQETVANIFMKSRSMSQEESSLYETKAAAVYREIAHKILKQEVGACLEDALDSYPPLKQLQLDYESSLIGEI